jgi:molybdopterin-guanine dinucleotide biosynthesis protein A
MPQTAILKGLVLAGGESSRMGRDKASIELAGVNMLARTVELLDGRVTDVLVAVRPEQTDDAVRRRHTLIEDCYSDIGPAAGMFTAHEQSPEAAWLVLACDMPLLSPQALDSLIGARDPEMDATALCRSREAAPEPLCAIYEPGNLAAFLAAVRGGENSSPRAWLQRSRVLRVEAPEGGVLASINTSDELSDVRRQLEASVRAAGRKQ